MSTVFRDRLKLLGDRADDLARYQAEAEARVEAEARERQETQRRATESQQVAALRAEIADLRARLDAHDRTIVPLADVIDALIDKTPIWVEKMIEGGCSSRKPRCAARSRKPSANCVV